MADAFGHVFPIATRLLCAIHKRRNIEATLTDMKVPDNIQCGILDAIFGKGKSNTYVEGLIDAIDARSFELKLEVLRTKWESLVPGTAGEFCSWFIEYECLVIKSTMLRPVREAAGLGSPPEQFSTNASESANALMKSKIDYKRSDLPVFIRKME